MMANVAHDYTNDAMTHLGNVIVGLPDPRRNSDNCLMVKSLSQLTAVVSLRLSGKRPYHIVVFRDPIFIMFPFDRSFTFLFLIELVRDC